MTQGKAIEAARERVRVARAKTWTVAKAWNHCEFDDEREVFAAEGRRLWRAQKAAEDGLGALQRILDS